MQPYAVLGKPNTHQSLPPRPVSWTSKHQAQVQTQEISQPRPRIVEQSSSSSISNNYGVERGWPSNQHPSRSHLIDMNKQSLLGFKVGEGNGNGTFRQAKGIAPTEPYLFGSANSPAKQFQTERNQDQINSGSFNQKEYAIRLEGFEQKSPSQERYSYTRRLIHDIGHDDTNDAQPFNQKSKEERGEEVIINPEIEYGEGNLFRNLFRDLGIFEREKQYTNQIILTEREVQVLKTSEPPIYSVPRMDANASQMLSRMKPSPDNIEDYVEPVQSRVSMGSASSRRRQPIFTNSKVEYFEDSSKWPYENTSGNIYKKDNQIYFQEMEQSEVTPVEHSLRRELVPSNQPQESPRKRHKIFEDSHNESKSISFGQLEESSDPAGAKFKRSLDSNINSDIYGNDGGQKSNSYARNLIFEGEEQKNSERGDAILHKRELSSSSKFSGNASFKFEGSN